MSYWFDILKKHISYMLKFEFLIKILRENRKYITNSCTFVFYIWRIFRFDSEWSAGLLLVKTIMKRRPHDILPSLRISTEEMKLPPGQNTTTLKIEQVYFGTWWTNSSSRKDMILLSSLSIKNIYNF